MDNNTIKKIITFLIIVFYVFYVLCVSQFDYHILGHLIVLIKSIISIVVLWMYKSKLNVEESYKNKMLYLCILICFFYIITSAISINIIKDQVNDSKQHIKNKFLINLNMIIYSLITLLSGLIFYNCIDITYYK